MIDHMSFQPPQLTLADISKVQEALFKSDWARLPEWVKYLVRKGFYLSDELIIKLANKEIY